MTVWGPGTNVLDSAYASAAQAQNAQLSFLVPTGRSSVTLETYMQNNAVWNVLDGTTSQSPAIADGVTDNSVVFNDIASRVYAAGGGRVFLPPGNYVAKNVIARPGVEWCGNEGKARIMLPPSAGYWDRIFTTGNQEYAGASDSSSKMSFRNLILDGQRALRGAYAGGELQQSHLLSIGGNVAFAGRVQLYIDNVDFVESTGDGLSVGPNVDCVIGTATGRNCWRGVWTFYGGNSRVTIGVLKLQDQTLVERLGFHVETDVAGYGGSYVLELVAGVIDCGKAYAQITPNSTGSGSSVTIGSLISGVGTMLSGGNAKIQINGGRLDMGVLDNAFSRIINPSNMSLNGLEVRCSREQQGAGGGNKTFAGLHVFPNASGLTDAQRLTCNNVQFTVASDVLAGDTVKGVYVEPSLAVRDLKVELNNCTIASRYDVGAELGQGGGLYIKDTRNYAVLPVRVFGTTSGDNFHFNVSIDNMEVKAGIATWMHITSGTAGSKVTHKNCLLDTSVANVTTTSGFMGTVFDGERVILTTTAPDGVAPGLLSDRRRMRTPTSGQPYEYICTASSPTATTWKVLTTVA